MSRQKKETLDEPKEEEIILHWSKKRIVIGFVISIVILAVLYYFISSALQQSIGKNSSAAISEKKVSITPPMSVSIPSQKDMNTIIQQARNQLTHLTPDNVASSQSTLNTLILNLQKLQSGKESPKDAVCQLVCR